MNDDKDMNELNIDDLEVVTGGVSPIIPTKMFGSHLLRQMKQAITPETVSSDETVTTVTAFCKACGKPVIYLGNKRVEGGNTAEYKCTDPTCSEFDKIKYSDEVNHT